MNISFQPDGLWFVFVEATGKTIAKDLPTKRTAVDVLQYHLVKDDWR